MSHYYYITPEEYDVAAHNGIAAPLLEWRIRDAAWPKEKAISTPPKTQKDHGEWRKIAEQNGISASLFRHRVNALEWSAERAATQPMITKEQRRELMLKAKAVQMKFPPALIRLAEQNGIASSTFYNRVKLGWDRERAATEPLWSDVKKGQESVRKVRQRYGDINGLIFNKLQPASNAKSMR